MVTESNIWPQSLQYRDSDRLATFNDLQQLKSEILAEVRNFTQRLNDGPSKRWLKSYEVRKILHISPGTLQTLRKNGLLPFTRVGGIIYYEVEDINNLLSNSKALRKS